MSDFKQMKLVDRDDTFDVTGRLESEEELAALAWAIICNGSLTDLSASEIELVDTAGEASDSISDLF